MTKQKIEVVIDGKNSAGPAIKQASDELKRLGAASDESRSALERLNQAGGGLTGLAASVKAAAAGLAAFGATSFFHGAIREQEQLQRNLLRTEAVIKATGSAAGFSAQELQQQARQLALNTLASTEGVMQAQQVLLSYSNVQGENFSRTIELANDLSSLMGSSLVGATETLAKALDAPAERLSSLTRIGFTFDEQQKAQIKTLVEQNRVFEAQAIILDTVASSFGGLAAAEAQGLAGAQDTFGQMVQEAKIAIAEQLQLSDRAAAGYNAMSEVVVKLTENIDLLIRGGEILALVVGGKVVAAATASASAFVAAQIQAIRYQAALASMAGVSRTAAAAITAQAAAARAASSAMALLGGPVGAATIAAGALYLYTRDATDAQLASEFLGRSTDELVESFNKVGPAIQRARLERLREEIRQTAENAESSAARIQRAFEREVRGWGILRISDDAEQALDRVDRAVRGAARGIEQDWFALADSLKGVNGVSEEAVRIVIDLAGKQVEASEKSAELARILETLENASSGAAEAQRELAEATTDQAGSTYLAGLKRRLDLAGQLNNEQRTAIEIAKGYAGELSKADQQAALSHARALDRIDELTRAESDALRDIDRIRADRLKIEQRYKEALAGLQAGAEPSYGAAQDLKVKARQALASGDIANAQAYAQQALKMLQDLAAAGENTYGFEGFIKELQAIELAASDLEQSQAEAKLEGIRAGLDSLKKGAEGLENMPVSVQADEASFSALRDSIAKLAADLGRELVIPVSVQAPSGGGDLPGFASGGYIRGPGTGTSDSILARLSNGEFVMRAAAVKHYGPQLLSMMNGLQLPKFADGGLVEGVSPSMPHLGKVDLSLGGETTTIYVDESAGLDLRRLAMKHGRTSRR